MEGKKPVGALKSEQRKTRKSDRRDVDANLTLFESD
jgi:hypothetical protein